MKLIVAMIGLGVVYAAACTWSPYGSCWRCGQAGQHRGLIRRTRIVGCWWCDSSGQRLRLGRRVYNWLAKARREGQARRTEKAGTR